MIPMNHSMNPVYVQYQVNCLVWEIELEVGIRENHPFLPKVAAETIAVAKALVNPVNQVYGTANCSCMVCK